MKHLLLYAALAAAWAVALRREAARTRYLQWLDTWAKDLEEFVARWVIGFSQTGITVAEATERITVNTRAAAAPPRMTSPRDAASGMTLDELLGDIDDLIEETAR